MEKWIALIHEFKSNIIFRYWVLFFHKRLIDCKVYEKNHYNMSLIFFSSQKNRINRLLFEMRKIDFMSSVFKSTLEYPVSSKRHFRPLERSLVLIQTIKRRNLFIHAHTQNLIWFTPRLLLLTKQRKNLVQWDIGRDLYTFNVWS